MTSRIERSNRRDQQEPGFPGGGGTRLFLNLHGAP